MSNVEDRRDYGTFIPSFLDDFRLDPMAFRLYAHIARRAGSGICWESIDRMAEVCQMNRKTAYKSFEILKSQNMILVEKRKGKTSIITLTNHIVWEPIPNKVQVAPIPNQVQPYPKSGIPPIPNQVQPPIPDLVQPPVPNQGHKGIPIKVIPLSESLECNNTHKNEKSFSPENSDQTFEVFREVWNRDRPKHWSECRTFNDARISALKKFTKQYGDRSIGIFQNALFYAQNDKWCQKPETVLTINNFLSNSKPFEWSEKYDSRQNNPASCGNTAEDYLSAIAHL